MLTMIESRPCQRTGRVLRQPAWWSTAEGDGDEDDEDEEDND